MCEDSTHPCGLRVAGVGPELREAGGFAVQTLEQECSPMTPLTETGVRLLTSELQHHNPV